MPAALDEVKELTQLLRDPNPVVRRLALHRLSMCADRSVVSLVKEATSDPDGGVAAQAQDMLSILMRRGGDTRAGDRRPRILTSVEREPSARSLDLLRRVGLTILRPFTLRIAAYLGHPSVRLSQAAAAALGKIADATTLDALRDGLELTAVAQECTKALARIPDPRATDILLKLLDTADRQLLRAVMVALQSMREPRVLARLYDLARHADDQVRADAVMILGEIGEPSIAQHLIGLLNDPAEPVVIQAIDALRKLNFPGIIDEVVGRFDRAQSDRVRATLLSCLIQHPRDDRVIALLTRGLKDPNPRVRANAVEAVASLKISPDRKQGLLANVGADPDNRVLANLAVALGSIDAVKSLTILTRLLNSPEKRERASAVYAAGFVNEMRVGTWLASALVFEEDEDVIRNIISSLSRFRDPVLLEQLTRSLHHPKKIVRFGTARILGNVGDRAARQALINALDQENDAMVKAEMIAALARLSDTSHIPHFVRHLKDADPRVQANIIDSLDLMGVPEVIPHVSPFIASLDNRVKANAARVLWAQGQLGVVANLGQMLESTSEREVLSAIYAIGEIGQTLGSLADTHRYFILSAALRQRGKEMGFEGTAEAVMREPERTSKFLLDHWETFERLKSGVLNGAVDQVEQSLVGAHANPLGHYLAGELYRRTDGFEKAARHFERVESQASHFLSVFVGLANLHHNAGDTHASLVYYLKGLREKVALIKQEIEMALELAKSERLQEASLLLKTLIEQVPLDLTTHARIGAQALRYGDVEKAFHHLALAFVTDPADRSVQYDLALAAHRLALRPLAMKLIGGLLPALAEADPLLGPARDLAAQIGRDVPEGPFA